VFHEKAAVTLTPAQVNNNRRWRYGHHFHLKNTNGRINFEEEESKVLVEVVRGIPQEELDWKKITSQYNRLTPGNPKALRQLKVHYFNSKAFKKLLADAMGQG